MLPYSGRWNRLREEAPLRITYQAISPFVLTGDLARTWVKLLGVLRAYPSTGRHQWVRDRRWVDSRSTERGSLATVEGSQPLYADRRGNPRRWRWGAMVNAGGFWPRSGRNSFIRRSAWPRESPRRGLRSNSSHHLCTDTRGVSASDRSGSLETVRERVPINRRIDSKARIRHERTSLTVKRLEEGAICDSIRRFNSGNSANG